MRNNMKSVAILGASALLLSSCSQSSGDSEQIEIVDRAYEYFDAMGEIDSSIVDNVEDSDDALEVSREHVSSVVSEYFDENNLDEETEDVLYYALFVTVMQYDQMIDGGDTMRDTLYMPPEYVEINDDGTEAIIYALASEESLEDDIYDEFDEFDDYDSLVEYSMEEGFVDELIMVNVDGKWVIEENNFLGSDTLTVDEISMDVDMLLSETQGSDE